MLFTSLKSVWNPALAAHPPKPSMRVTLAVCAFFWAFVVALVVFVARASASLGSALLAAMAVVALAWGSLWMFVLRPKMRAFKQLSSGLCEFADRKFSTRLGREGERELGELASKFDEVGVMLGSQQGGSIQRDALLKTIVGSAPMAIVLYGDTGKIVYANDEARELFYEGKELEGHNFLHMLQQAPEALRSALLADNAALFTLEDTAERETYHLAKRYFDINDEPHTLVMVKHLTRELGRREAEVYKRVIRVISHEFNNSLAPITSLIHSARLISQKPEHLPKLGKVLDTIEERAIHLNSFLEGYASFARLPRPRPQVVAWGPFLDGIKSLWPTVKVCDPPARAGYFDAAQMQQVLLNLLKNADEAKAERSEVALIVESTQEGGTRFLVSDRGRGMSCEVLKSALEPFFSTKERGSGVGLALCREIVEAHNGKMKLEVRDGGGTVVSCWLPAQGTPSSARTARLTLSQG